jgi:hypothetical protein
MTDAESSAPPDGKAITEHELEQCQRANQTGRQPVGVRPRSGAAAEQLGSLGEAV